jgi:hypothetical protein
LVPGASIVFKISFLMVVSGIKYIQKIFEIFFMSKNKVFGPVQILKGKTFFEFFSSISRGLCTGTKCEKVVHFEFSTGTKSEKYHFFDISTGTKSQRNRRKKFKKSFFF